MNRRTEATAGQIVELDPRRVKPFADQPRKRFRGIKQLAESIRLVGQITPVIVTPCSEDGYDAELIDGERRLRACLLGNMPIKAILESDGDAAERYVRSVAANFCRQGHDAVEILEAVLALKAAGRTVAEIAGIFGKTASWVAQYMQLRKLVPEVLEQLKAPGDEVTKSQRRRRGRMTLSVALLLTPMPPQLQVKAMRGIMVGKMSMAEARTFVYKMAAGKGKQVGARQSPRERFKSVRSAVDNCYHVVERYLTMPGSHIKTLVSTAAYGEKRALADRLDKLCESLLMFHDELVK